MAERGKFIVFEGIDGSGKSTQVRILTEKLRQERIECYATMEPTDSPIGSLIHQIMTGRVSSDPKVIAALFVADRLDHLLNDVNGICKKIEEGTTVLMDRYCFSSYAYQSVDVPMDWVIGANRLGSDILRPDVNLFLDVDPELALERISRNRFDRELFEERSRLVRVREKYIEAFERMKGEERVVILNGSKSREEVSADVWKIVKEVIG